MKKEKWYGLSQASEELGRGRTYVSLWLRRHREEFPDDMLMEAGNTKLISAKGVEWIRDNTKKEGAHVNSSSVHVDKYLKLAILGKTLMVYFTGRVRGRLGNLIVS